MSRRRVILAILLAPLAFLAAVSGVRHLLRPPLSDWRPVFRGVEYRGEDLPGSGAGRRRVAALRIDLDAPGLDIVLRPTDPAAAARGGHYFLSIPDLDIRRGNFDILINTAIYEPGQIWQSYPGQVVRAVDMVVLNGRATHFWEHSYLLWLDRRRVPHLNFYKPPRPEDIASAAWGIGLQGVQVSGGKPRYQATNPDGPSEARTFIGFDAAQRKLFLIAFEDGTAREMINTAVRLGVQEGGMMDSGNATWLLFSSRAKGLRPGTGIRGGRPLGPWLALRAAPLP